MTQFTPIASTIGGMLIGLSAVLLMLSIGKIAGISGIASRLLPPVAEDYGWRIAFVLGLIAAPVAAHLATGRVVEQTVSSNLALMAVAGLLVGFGSVLGSGCTSGHGVCGISRLSGRSIVATLTFMATAIVTLFVASHLVGL